MKNLNKFLTITPLISLVSTITWACYPSQEEIPLLPLTAQGPLDGTLLMYSLEENLSQPLKKTSILEKIPLNSHQNSLTSLGNPFFFQVQEFPSHNILYEQHPKYKEGYDAYKEISALKKFSYESLMITYQDPYYLLGILNQLNFYKQRHYLSEPTPENRPMFTIDLLNKGLWSAKNYKALYEQTRLSFGLTQFHYYYAW